MARCRYCRPIKTTERKIRCPGIRSLGVGPPTRDSLRLTLVKWIFSAVYRYINHHLSPRVSFFLSPSPRHTTQPATHVFNIILLNLTHSAHALTQNFIIQGTLNIPFTKHTQTLLSSNKQTRHTNRCCSQPGPLLLEGALTGGGPKRRCFAHTRFDL